MNPSSMPRADALARAIAQNRRRLREPHLGDRARRNLTLLYCGRRAVCFQGDTQGEAACREDLGVLDR